MHLVELVFAGLVLGFLNTVSSGGSVISLPLLVSIGYPAAVANATNRVPVAIGLLIAIWQFHRAGSIPWSYCFRLVPLILFGTFLGVQISLLIPRSSLSAAINFAVVMALILLLIKPRRWLGNDSAAGGALRFSPQLLIFLFLVSVWNGFIVLDAGTYFLLTLTLVGGMGLSQANVMKVFLMGVSGLFSLILFTGYDTVNWSAAFPLALGSVAGSMIGSRLVLGRRAKQWIYWSLVSAISIGLLFKVVEYLL
jgi:uncharacterized membrane protein YfcA